MKQYTDKQKYLIIFWYHFLKDVNEYNMEDALNHLFPGYKIDWKKNKEFLSWASENDYRRKRVYPWPLYGVKMVERKNRFDWNCIKTRRNM